MGNPTSQSNAQSLRDVLVGLSRDYLAKRHHKKNRRKIYISAIFCCKYQKNDVTLQRKEKEYMKSHSKQYRKLHFAVMVIEATAKKQNVAGEVMYQRLKAQDLIRQRLLMHYDSLHTQSLDWVVEDTIETLNNWEKEGKEYAQ